METGLLLTHVLCFLLNSK